jgi:hypothetical protein
MNPASRSLASRVEGLEQQNRRLRWLLLGLPAGALLLGASAAQLADWKGKSVTAEKLILVDGNGKERGALYVHGGEPVLELYNKDHSLILNAGKSRDNGVGFMQFFDGQGTFKGGVGGNALK